MGRICGVGAGRVVATVVLGVMMLAAASVGAAAHPGHSHGDGRIPGQPDVKRVGKAEFRFHPDSHSYTYKRGPKAPPLSFHVDGTAASRSGATSLPTMEEPVVCATSGHRIRVMYSSATSATPSATHANEIRTAIRRMNSKILRESWGSSANARGLRMRVDCDANGQINILGFTSSGDFEDVFEEVDDLFGAPLGANSVKNLVFYAGSDPRGVAAGYGLMYDDSDKTSSDSYPVGGNVNRVVTATGIVYGGYWWQHTSLHELFHTMGAVQPDAPYATWGGHCWDGIDVLCYNDGAMWSSLYQETRCPANGYYDSSPGIPLDCMYDSYFDAGEESGEWLNTHWNLAGVENPFLVTSPSPTCDYNNFTSAIRTGHINSDSKEDVFQFAGGQGLYGWHSTGSSYTSLSQIGTGFGSSYQDRLGDMDGDGDDDGFQVLDDGRVYAWLSNGSSYTGIGLIDDNISTGGACEIRMLDMNGDGKDDIMRFTAGGQGHVWLSTGTDYTYIGQKGTGYGPAVEMRSGDIDGDGDDDLLRFLDNGNAYGWRSNGTGFVALGTVGTGFGNNYQVRIGDRDNDGDDDAFQFTDGGVGYAWRSDGSWYTQLGQIGTGFGVTRKMRTADMNADGKADILKFEDTGIGYAWQANGSGYTYLGQIGTGFGAP